MQVKGVMLLWQPNPEKHRPAKPCGKAGLNNIFMYRGNCYDAIPKTTVKQVISGRAILNKDIQEKRGGKMAKETEKLRKGFYIDKDILERVDRMMEEANARSRNEFVTEALKFYIGYLTTRRAEDYLLQSLGSVISGTVHDSENRIARIDFKIAVELSKLAHVIAYTHEIGEDTLQKLHVKCVDEIRRINGAIDFEEAYKYQRREK